MLFQILVKNNPICTETLKIKNFETNGKILTNEKNDSLDFKIFDFNFENCKKIQNFGQFTGKERKKMLKKSETDNSRFKVNRCFFGTFGSKMTKKSFF